MMKPKSNQFYVVSLTSKKPFPLKLLLCVVVSIMVTVISADVSEVAVTFPLRKIGEVINSLLVVI